MTESYVALNYLLESGSGKPALAAEVVNILFFVLPGSVNISIRLFLKITDDATFIIRFKKHSCYNQ